eukprot:scaffold59762_cov33-Attheya_sp.AAC.1
MRIQPTYALPAYFEWSRLTRYGGDSISTEFESVESSLKNDFLPALLGQSKIGQPWRDLLALPVKHAGIAIPNPTTSAGGNVMASTVVCGHLVAALRGKECSSMGQNTNPSSRKDGRQSKSTGQSSMIMNCLAFLDLFHPRRSE